MPSVIIPPTDVSPNTGTGSEVLSNSPTLTGSVTFGDGTSTAPSIRFASATGSGFYRANTNSIGIVNNGIPSGYLDGVGVSGGLYIAASGTNQSVMLAPSGAATNGVLTLSRLTSTSQTMALLNYGTDELMSIVGAGYTGIGSKSNTPLIFYSNNAERARFMAGGNLLIGKTTDNALGRLQVSGAITAEEAAGTGLFGFFGGSSLVVGTLGSASMVLRTNNTAALTFDNSQNASFTGNVQVPADKGLYLKQGNVFKFTSDGTTTGTSRADMYADSGGAFFIRTGGATQALTINSSQFATFSKDVQLQGSSGPQVLQTLAARATKQGIVTDGTRGVAVTAIPTFGTGDFTFAFIVRRNTNTVQQYLVGNDVGQCFYVGFRTNGDIFSGQSGGTPNADLSLATPLGRPFHLVLVRSAGTITAYVDALASATASDSKNYTGAATTLLAADGAGSAALDGLGIIQGIYNRALSATEVRQLYEIGTPDATDLCAAGSQLLTGNNSTFATGQGTWQGINGGSVSAGSGVLTITTTGAYVGGGTENGLVKKGVRYRLVFTLASYTGALNAVMPFVNNGAILGVGAYAAGTFTIDFTAPVTSYIGFSTANTNSGTFTIDNVTLVPFGALVAPDPAQTGGGLTWYDTSGNAANITLPASGVAWNVPTSGNLTSSSALNLRAGGTNQNITLTATGTGATVVSGASALASGELGNFRLQDASNTNRKLFFGIDNTVAPNGVSYIQSVLTGTTTLPLLLNPNGGGVLIGTAVDSGSKLQVGTNTTAASGGMIFGTDVTLYRSAADTLKTDDAFAIQRDINQEFFGFNVANANTGTSALVTASVSNGAYGAGFTMGGQNFTNTSFLRGNRLALTGPFDINYVSAQHFFWIGGGGAGTSTAGSQLVFSLGLGAKITHSPISFSTSSWLTNGAIAEFSGSTVTNNSTAASGTAASAVAYSFAVPSFAATNASVTTTNAATLYVAGNPTASTNQTFTNAWGIWNAGRTKLGGFVRIDDNSTSSSKDTGCLVVEGGIGVEENVNVGGFYGLADGIAAPGAATGYARIYVDTADGDLKVIFGDGTIKTIATDS